MSSRRSPATVVAVLALVAALAGTALAGETATTSVSKKQTKKIAKKQAKKQIAALAPGLSVAHADTADSATSADTADVAGGPVAVGHISNPITGAVNGARTRGFTSVNVTSPSTGTYCFGGLDFAFRVVNVTTDFNTSGSFSTAQVGLPQSGGCPPGTEAEVSTAFQDGAGGDFEDSGFFIAFYN